MFGLFHGLAYLPVVLSCFGPEDTLEQTDDSSSNSDDFSTSPTSTASSAMTPIKDKLSVSVMALDNPAFISDHQVFTIFDKDNRICYYRINRHIQAMKAIAWNQFFIHVLI